MKSRIQKSVTIAASLMAVSFAITSCSGANTEGDAAGGASESPSYNEELHAALPDKVKESGEFTVVMPGVNPPWFMEEGDGYTGAAAELSYAMGDILGVDIAIQPMSKISSAIASVSSGRYQMAFGPYGDTSDQVGEKRRKNVEYIDVVQEVVPFLVPKGNPAGIENVFKLCGPHKIAAQVNGGAYKMLEDESKKCEEKGKEPFKVVGVDGVPNGVLAVKSNRADAFFSAGAALYYYAQNSDGVLEIAGDQNSNGYEGLYQGIVMPTDSKLTEPVLKAFEILFENGTYEEIMKEYNLSRQMLDAPGIDLAAKNAE